MANLQNLIKESCSNDSKYTKTNNPVFKEINEKLKPCPFCGKRVELMHKDDQFVVFTPEDVQTLKQLVDESM